jgi:hypothetical protein
MKPFRWPNIPAIAFASLLVAGCVAAPSCAGHFRFRLKVFLEDH